METPIFLVVCLFVYLCSIHIIHTIFNSSEAFILLRYMLINNFRYEFQMFNNKIRSGNDFSFTYCLWCHAYNTNVGCCCCCCCWLMQPTARLYGEEKKCLTTKFITKNIINKTTTVTKIGGGGGGIQYKNNTEFNKICEYFTVYGK